MRKIVVCVNAILGTSYRLKGWIAVKIDNAWFREGANAVSETIQ